MIECRLVEHHFELVLCLCFVSECGVCIAMNLIMVCGMLVWCSLCMSVCMLTVSNAMLISCATVIVRSDGVCSELCPVCFPIVRECLVCCSLYLVRVLIVVIIIIIIINVAYTPRI